MNLQLSKIIIPKKYISYAKAYSLWDFGNSLLYRICKKYPLHRNKEVVTLPRKTDPPLKLVL